MLAFIAFFLLSLCILWQLKPIKNTKEAPQPAGAWPIIGHLHLFAKGGLPHITLANLADSYGPAITIRLGMRRALVVSDWEIAKECLTTNDKAFATRPSLVAIKHMGYNYAMFGFAPHGSYWRELRKMVMLELLSNNRLRSLNHVWASEIDTSVKELYQVWANHKKNQGAESVMVEMRQWFGDLTVNVAVKLVAGKRFSGNERESRRCQKGMRDFFRLVGIFVVSDALPFLGWLDLGGYEKEMKGSAKEIDSLLQGWLDEHRRKRQSGKTNEDQNFMGMMHSILQDSNLAGYNVDTVNKATCMSMILGASDTTMVTLTWALSLLLNNPHVLKKAQDELDVHVSRDRHVEESDIKNLVYLQAIIKEAMRLCPAGPLSAPHEAIEDCTVAGYTVPAGTRLIVNIWKIHRDPRVWSDPLEFRPERFLTDHAHMDVRGQHFQLIPFGSGRRSCPGISLALQIVQLALARTLHGFELETDSGSTVDMTGSPGLACLKATPLEVLITPRLSSKLYI